MSKETKITFIVILLSSLLFQAGTVTAFLQARTRIKALEIGLLEERNENLKTQTQILHSVEALQCSFIKHLCEDNLPSCADNPCAL